LEQLILLSACSKNENLPQNSNYPADLFTSCLTTPIKTALRWFVQNNKMIEGKFIFHIKE
jgi:regulatory associated protein of mTOR